ncbi:molybdopterin molybdotransferase MoeA, partial [bacterium]|nr:molybdopterin molybdotransferase MoeA [bacterium]
MIAFDKAKELIEQNIRVVDVCQISLSEANKRVLGEDIFSQRNIPPHRNSAMDGYAFRIQDLTFDEEFLSKPFEIVSEISDTAYETHQLSKLVCIKVYTGSPLPDVVDTVVPIEEIRVSGKIAYLTRKPKVGAHIREAGENLKKGELATSMGTLLGPAEIGILASCGKYLIKAYRKPRIAILPTGDEICNINDIEASDKIIDCNSHIIAALLQDLNIEPVKLPICKDNKEALQSAFQIIDSCDGLITIAGISVGEFDLVMESLLEFGAELVFNKVAIKPARPTSFFIYNDKPVFCLPGNPVAAMIAFMEVFTPGIKKMMGYKKYENE